MAGMKVQTNIAVTWTPTVCDFKFEGQSFARDSATRIADVLADGSTFQIFGNLNQNIAFDRKPKGCKCTVS